MLLVFKISCGAIVFVISLYGYTKRCLTLEFKEYMKNLHFISSYC
ncbi:protein of unknown function [Maridesulfovibrio hydrothermalis AM13 = DSM 14728]|uniref:Uncharacterized protein n=1 Tax=Maridesulfovibrio hydrothermalis AM13 = DSM 14728 TaxID=1121451 RepID=L0RBG6_9BACT|nr:protein of unknown function [Maridesulfovibrio hydrothermalis AM13 = DSM 14728]